MKKLFAAITFILAFTTSYSQTCGNLTVTNNSAFDLVVGGIGGACGGFSDTPTQFIPSGGSATFAPTVGAPGSEWIALYYDNGSGTGVGQQFTPPCTRLSSAAYLTVIWTASCSAIIN